MKESFNLYSGGANGSDNYIGKIAETLGYNVYHFYPKGVKCPFGNTEVSKLETGIQMCKNVQNYIERNAPTKWPAKELCARDWNQVEKTQLVIAIGTLTPDFRNVNGGTGWAVAMAIWMRLPIVLIDNDSEKIFTYSYITKHKFVENNLQIVLNKLSKVNINNVTGIGTRALKESNQKMYIISKILSTIIE